MMKGKHIPVALLLAGFALFLTAQAVSASAERVPVERPSADGLPLAAHFHLASPLPQATSDVTATLWTPSGSLIEFKTQNGQTVNGVPPETRDLPHLVLYRDGILNPDQQFPFWVANIPSRKL